MTDRPDTPAADTPPAKRVGLPPGRMTVAHKEALKEGRRRGRIVRAYLEALQKSTRGRGRPVTREGLERRIAELGPKIDAAPDPLAKLELVQKKIGLQQQLTDMDAPVDISDLEAQFITVAKEYGDAKNISVEAWRELKVPRLVLKRAGIV
jgi:hypothetical protein